MFENLPYKEWADCVVGEIELKQKEIEYTKTRMRAAKGEFRQAWAIVLESEELFLEENQRALTDFLNKHDLWSKDERYRKLFPMRESA